MTMHIVQGSINSLFKKVLRFLGLERRVSESEAYVVALAVILVPFFDTTVLRALYVMFMDSEFEFFLIFIALALFLILVHAFTRRQHHAQEARFISLFLSLVHIVLTISLIGYYLVEATSNTITLIFIIWNSIRVTILLIMVRFGKVPLSLSAIQVSRVEIIVASFVVFSSLSVHFLFFHTSIALTVTATLFYWSIIENFFPRPMPMSIRNSRQLR